MTIIYPDEEEMLGSLTNVNVKMKMEPELYIYIQKLMKEQDKSFDQIVNEIIRDKAERFITTKIEYVPVRDVQPYVYPYNDSIDKTPKIWCGIDSSITTSPNETITSGYINTNYTDPMKPCILAYTNPFTYLNNTIQYTDEYMYLVPKEKLPKCK